MVIEESCSERLSSIRIRLRDQWNTIMLARQLFAGLIFGALSMASFAQSRTSMTRLFYASVIAAVALISSGVVDARATNRVRSAPIACAPPDAFANAFREWAVGVATGADSTAGERTALGITVLPDTAIAFVTDSTLCDTAAHKHAIQARQDTIAPPPVYLLRLGATRYVAFNGARSGEFHSYFVFDQAFTFLLAYVM
jgi:hypothetical protein